MTSGTPARVGAVSYALVCGISHLRDAAWKRGGLQSLQSMTVEQAQAVLDRVEQLEAEMRRYLPVIERAEANAGLWVLLTAGTGIATANGYRAALSGVSP